MRLDILDMLSHNAFHDNYHGGFSGGEGPELYAWCLDLRGGEAFLVSSLPPFKDATPQPLRIRSEPPFNIDQALNSVLSLTVLHYGSVRSPRLPVTIHYSDRIAYLALQ